MRADDTRVRRRSPRSLLVRPEGSAPVVASGAPDGQNLAMPRPVQGPQTEAPTIRVLLAGTILAALAMIIAAATAVAGDPIQHAEGCGVDGAYYCELVRGGTTREPYSHRILVPALVRVVFPSLTPPAGFFAVNLLALAAIGAATAVLTRRVASALGAAASRSAAAAAAAGSVSVASLMAFKFTAYDPVLIDHVATALLLWWIVAATTQRRGLQLGGAVLGALAILTKESAIIPFFLVGIGLVRSPASRRMAVASAAMAVAALAFVLTLPGEPNPNITSLAAFIRHNVVSVLSDRAAAVNLLWGTLLSLTLTPVVLVTARRRLERLWGTGQPSPLGSALWLAVVAPFVLVAVAGVDSPRYLYQAAPPAFALSFGAVAADARFDRWALGIVVATTALGRPAEVLDGSLEQGEMLFAPIYSGPSVLYRRALFDVGVVGVVVIVILLSRVAWLAAGRRLRPARLVPPPERSADDLGSS